MHFLVASSQALGLMVASSQDLVPGLKSLMPCSCRMRIKTPIGITSENIVTLNRIIFSDGINVDNNSRITFAYPGQYLVTARFQFANRGNAEQIFEIWAKNTGVNYPLSNTRLTYPQEKASLFTRTSQPTFQVFLRLRTGSILSLPGGRTGQICTLSTTLPGHLPHGQKSHRLSSRPHLSHHSRPDLFQLFQIGFHWLV
jgi:hypothetical protein